VRGIVKVLDSLSSVPRHSTDPAPQGSARMPPASRGLPLSGDPDRMVARGPIDPSPRGEKSEIPEPISKATSDAFVAPETSSDIDPEHVYSRDIDPEPRYEDAVDSLSMDARARTFMGAHAIFRSFSVRLMQKLALASFSSVLLHARDETNLSAVAAPHSNEAEAIAFSRSIGSDVWLPAPVRAAAEGSSAASAAGMDRESVSPKASVATTTADTRVLQLQHELQMARMQASLDLQETRFNDALKRQELESRFEMQQVIAQAQLEAQAKIYESQQSAEAQVRAQQQAADLAAMQALAERLDKPREQRPIKDISSDSLVKCPLEKGKDDMTEWAMALAATASGLCESASEMIMMVMARDATVLAFAAAPENIQADRWLARQINASIKEDTEAGRLFHKEARQEAPRRRRGWPRRRRSKLRPTRPL
jgi:hypothetical protein